MLLSTLLAEFYLPSRIELAYGYVEALTITVRKFSRFLGRQAKLVDLTESSIASFLADYRKSWSARSTNNRRSHLVTLWIAAFDAGLVDRMPNVRRLRKLKTNPDPPIAWTVEQVSALLLHTENLRGSVCGLPANDYWYALFSAVYWTGCRIAAMMRTTSDCYTSGDGILVRKQKNKRPQWYPLGSECCDAIDRIHPNTRQLIFPYDKHPHTIFTDARRIIEAAGLPCPRGRGLHLFHRMRRTTISYCAVADTAVAQQVAGHSSYATTRASYVDPRIACCRSAIDVLPDPTPRPKPLYESLGFRIYG